MAIAPFILKSLSQSKKNLSQAGEGTKKITSFIMRRRKVKRDSYAQTNMFRDRREQYDRRQQIEDELEAPKRVTQPGGPAQLVQQDNNKGFFDRILGFIGYLAAGWIMNNLPTWIGIGKEFLARIKKAGEIVSGFFGDTIKIFTGFGNLLSAAGENLMRFDFFDTSNRIKNAMKELNFTVGDMGNKIEEAYGLATTPITEGKYSGEDIPGTGTQQTNQGAYEEPAPYTGQQVSGGSADFWLLALIALYENSNPQGAADVAQSIYNRMGYSGRTARQVILSSGQYEPVSKFGGYAAWGKVVDRDTAIAHIKRYPGNGASVSGLDKVASSLSNKSMQQSAAAFVGNRPDFRSQGYENSYNDMNNDTTRYGQTFGFNKGSAYAGKSATAASVPNFGTSLSSTAATITSQGQTGTFIQGTTGKSTGPHFHFGPGTADAKVAQQGDVFPGKYYSDVRDVSFNVAKHFLKQKKGFLLSRSGRWINPGISDNDLRAAILVEQKTHTRKGSDGGIDMAFSDNVRLPMVVTSVKDRGDGFGISGTISGTNVFVGHGSPGSISGQGTNVVQSPAQISPAARQSQAVPSALTPDRKGQDIIIAQPRNQQQIVTSSGGGGQQGSSPITEFDLLNNFIKNKLLLDLAYL